MWLVSDAAKLTVKYGSVAHKATRGDEPRREAVQDTEPN